MSLPLGPVGARAIVGQLSSPAVIVNTTSIGAKDTFAKM